MRKTLTRAAAVAGLAAAAAILPLSGTAFAGDKHHECCDSGDVYKKYLDFDLSSISVENEYEINQTQVFD